MWGITRNRDAGRDWSNPRPLPNAPMPTRLSFISYLTMGILVTISQIGCVALNIPSERLHDPADHGGFLGDWRTGFRGHDGACHGGTCEQSGCQNGSCEYDSCEFSGHCLHPMALGGGPLECDPFDPCDETAGNRKPDEVPWPRFHPVPTRPVFSGPAIQ